MEFELNLGTGLLLFFIVPYAYILIRFVSKAFFKSKKEEENFELWEKERLEEQRKKREKKKDL